MSKDLFVRREDNTKRVIYLTKELLKDAKELNVMASHIGADVATRVCNALVNMNYVKIEDIKTLTEVVNGRRKLTISIKLTKTSEFDKLYEESVKKREEMKAKRNEEKKEGETKN